MGEVGQTWESLKARTKTRIADLDSKMQELGGLNKKLSSANSASPGDRVTALDGQIQRIVGLRDQVERSFGELEGACESLAQAASTSAQATQAARLRETH